MTERWVGFLMEELLPLYVIGKKGNVLGTGEEGGNMGGLGTGEVVLLA